MLRLVQHLNVVLVLMIEPNYFLFYFFHYFCFKLNNFYLKINIKILYFTLLKNLVHLKQSQLYIYHHCLLKYLVFQFLWLEWYYLVNFVPNILFDFQLYKEELNWDFNIIYKIPIWISFFLSSWVQARRHNDGYFLYKVPRNKRK